MTLYFSWRKRRRVLNVRVRRGRDATRPACMRSSLSHRHVFIGLSSRRAVNGFVFDHDVGGPNTFTSRLPWIELLVVQVQDHRRRSECLQVGSILSIEGFLHEATAESATTTIWSLRRLPLLICPKISTPHVALALNVLPKLDLDSRQYFKYHSREPPNQSRRSESFHWKYSFFSFLARLRSGTIEAIKETRCKIPRALIEVASYSQHREYMMRFLSLVQYPIDHLKNHLDRRCAPVHLNKR